MQTVEATRVSEPGRGSKRQPRLRPLLLTGAMLSVAAGAIGRSSLARRVVGEATKRSHLGHYVEHSHEAIVHDHEHPHIVHNRREGADEVMGEWEHLTALHRHEHEHAALTHSHLAHEDAEHEHLGEAHNHRHPAISR